MEKLKQNTLAEATTDLGFCKTINENAGETVVSLVREIELDDGTTVKVEGITADTMRNILSAYGTVSDKTPGEPTQVYVDDTVIGPVETETLDGVVQVYNTDNTIVSNLANTEENEEDTIKNDADLINTILGTDDEEILNNILEEE